jgi:hydroxymethylglutaryl-CoA synthase
MFSYGSGLASCFFSIRVSGDVEYIKSVVALREHIDGRVEVDPATFEEMMVLREASHQKEYAPRGSLDLIRPGTYYLDRIDSQWRRYYLKR